MPRDMRAVVYHSDDGNDYVIGMDARYLSQVDGGGANLLGAVAYTGTPVLEPLPREVTPRKATYTVAGYRRSLEVCTTGADAFSATPSAINLFDGLGTTHAGATRLRTTGERDKRRHRAPGV
jgi:hypothetical protein